MGREGELLLGRGQRGRGAWLCPGSPSCFERAVRGGALSRALRRSVPAEVGDALRRQCTKGAHIGGARAQVCEDGGSGRSTGTPLVTTRNKTRNRIEGP